jgi:ribonuclease E
MSEKSTPAGKTGGDTPTTASAALADLPAKIRIHALAKLLGRSSREVLAAVTEAGVSGRSVQSSIDKEVALKVAESFGVTTGAAPTEAAAAEAAEPAQPAGRKVPPTPVFASAQPLFQPPQPVSAPPRPRAEPEVEDEDVADEGPDTDEDGDDARPRRRRGRRGRGRGRGGQNEDGNGEDRPEEDRPAKSAKDKKDDKPADRQDKQEKSDKGRGKGKGADESDAGDDDESDSASRRRRRRRRRKGGVDDEGGPTEDDPPNTVVHVRESRGDKDADKESDGRDEVRSVRGSTRLEAKRQRRRDGREAGRRRAPILSEAEFLARRESVDRAMVVRERGDRIQIGVLEDGVLVEHFVTSAGSGSLVGNVYLGRVQNVLPSMEAAFVDIGRGRNAVLYAGEVDWDAAGLEGKARKIEQALSTGDSVLVQVTKDPVGHKGARLTTQISLPGRFLVYVPSGGATGISRKLPENERRRLKDVLKRVVPEDAGVIIRTASEGVSEDELARDVSRLQAQWQVIQDKTQGTNGTKRVNAPALVYEEPDLLVKVVRDLFTEDFSALVIQGDTAWETVDAYVRHVAPELADRVRKHASKADVFTEYRIEEQLLKALDRKVWLPSGGYLVIDRTEAMTVIDVNTGKFTGSGGNLEETVTRNNLESAEEIVRQLRLRDIGGIIVIDFIDMVLESNRDLVLRRLTECLGRDRTRHQVAEVTSLGLVQMTRKRVGTGLLEAFGTTCEHCKGRGVLVSTEPVGKPAGSNGSGSGRRSRRGGGEDKEAAAKEAAAKEAAKAVRDIAKATTKANGESLTTGGGATSDADGSLATPVNSVDHTDAAAGSPADSAASLAGPSTAEPAVAMEPAVEPSAEPATEPITESAGELDAESEPAGVEPTSGLAAELAVEPIIEPTDEPTVELAVEPLGPAAEPVEPVEPVGESAFGQPGESAAPQRPLGRIRRRSSRGAGEPSPTIDRPAPPTVSTVPAGTESFTRAGEHGGGLDEANGNPHEADQVEQSAKADGSAPQEPGSGPLRRPVRRGGSRPAGPPVSAGHDG